MEARLRHPPRRGQEADAVSEAVPGPRQGAWHLHRPRHDPRAAAPRRGRITGRGRRQRRVLYRSGWRCAGPLSEEEPVASREAALDG